MKKTNTLIYLLIGLLLVIVQTIPANGQSLKEIYATGTVAFVAEMTIDESTLPEDEFFEGIIDIGADAAGNIYLCDFQACNIKKFSSDGKFLKIISTHQILRNKYRNIQGMFSNIIQPFTPDVFWYVAPDGKIVIGLAEDYTVETHHFEKGLLSSFKHTYEAVKVTDQDKEQFFSGIAFSTTEGGDSELPKEIKKLTEFPKTKPAFDALLVDSEGNILVHPVRKDPEGSSPKFDAFAPEGKFIGIVNITGLKAFPREALMGKGFVWVIEMDEEGQTQVVKYRIAPGK